MDIQKLQALAVIQEAGSFSRAAETLGYSQAGLTYMMNSLENEVGLRLLDRSYSGVRLSETGKALMPKIHRLLQVYDSLNGEIRACKRSQESTLRLAALDTISTRWVPRAVAQLNVLSELTLPLVKVGGLFAAMKSTSTDEEIAAARSAIAQLGGQLAGCTDYPVPETDVIHRIVRIEKVRPTPKQFPRAFARIKKAPLV